MEQLGYIKALDGAPLYCCYHAAAEVKETTHRLYPVVICPSLFEERKSAYTALRRLAIRLAAAGHAVMRFDYRGSGESGGKPEARRWEKMAQDVAVVRKTLARLAGKRDSALLGLRLGGTLALQETLRTGGEAVLALAPIVKGSAQVRLWKMRSKIRAELTQSQESGVQSPESSSAKVDSGLQTPGSGLAVLDFDGFPVSSAFFEDVAAIDLTKDSGRLSCPGLLAQLSHREEPSAESVQLQETLGSRAMLKCLRIEPFWDKVDDVDTKPVEELVLQFLASV
jgi:pimeloyl-ACP methyl ester carboxylesterase